MALKKYREKRNFKATPEPSAKVSRKQGGELKFVIQKHAASHLHYDLRLEVDGVLKSWAVPKGPSLKPSDKRLAIMVEDHPFDYKDFEGIIPSGYGAGKVIIWDQGTYSVEGHSRKESEALMRDGLRKGTVHLIFEGEKLKGEFALARFKDEEDHWLIIKMKDRFASDQVITKNERSVVSGLRIEELGETKKDFLTHQDKVFWPKEGITKGELVKYYESIAPILLPYLKDRPESLRRYPDGIEGKSFFQKNVTKAPKWIKTSSIEHSGKIVNYMFIEDLDSLLYAINLGCIELHPFFSRIQSLQYPDFLVLDLDPENISFEAVIETARQIHTLLEDLEVPSVCKTSGARGLHICVPLQAKYTYDQAKQFAEILAHIVHDRLPSITSLKRSPKQRQKKVYIDYLQNNPGQTIAAPYSVRAKPGAPVSTPLEWREVKKGLDPLKFNLFNTKKRIEKKGDLFKPVLGKGISLLKVLKKIDLLIK